MVSAEISTENYNRYPRMLGYAITLVMHLTNGVQITQAISRELKDPNIKQFYENQLKFLTIWNAYAQTFYAALGLSCDVLTLSHEGKNSALLNILNKIRNPMFSSIVFPGTCTVVLVFWFFYSYDHSLFLPPSVDKITSGTFNHVVHTAILPVVLWEILFHPRKTPKSHIYNLLVLNVYAGGYLIVLISSYVQTGAWVYPILNILNGTVYLYVFLGVSTILLQLFYFLQWNINDLIIQKTDTESKKND